MTRTDVADVLEERYSRAPLHEIEEELRSKHVDIDCAFHAVAAILRNTRQKPRSVAVSRGFLSVVCIAAAALIALFFVGHSDPPNQIMLVLAASVAFAGSASLAALRLRTCSDKTHSRSYVFVTRTFWLYLLAHGIAAIVPFPVYWFWPMNWSPLLTGSPWVVAVTTPLFVNRLVRLQGLDLPEATGQLSRFRSKVSAWIHEALFDWETSAMHGFIAPFAKNMSVEEARILMSLYLPVHLSHEKEAAVRAALADAKTAERTMEIYIRMIGKHSFVALFGERLKEKKLAPTPLFDDALPDDFERRRQAHEKSRSA